MSYDYEVLENDESSTEEYAVAMQRAVNGGVAWKFQGSVGRSMMAAIEAGLVMLGTERATDYYGNVIGSRFDVVEGTKGSRQYVVAARGEEWAKMLESV